MILAALTSAILCGQLKSGFSAPWIFQDELKSYDRFVVSNSDGKLPQTRVSPKHEWGFDYLTVGYAAQKPDPLQWDIRFRIYAQERLAKADLAPLVARCMLRLWEYNFDHLKIDHAVAYRSLVDVYLAKQGLAGGEQGFMADPFDPTPEGKARTSNVIYIFHMDSFTDFLEMVREVAHEYGHATLPPVGGFTAPEAWANGELGERLYLRWMLGEMKTGDMKPIDTMGADATMLTKYVATKVTPLESAAATYGPRATTLKGTNKAAMDAYLGLALYLQTILPEPAFRRALVFGGAKAVGLVESSVTAVGDLGRVEFNLSAYRGKSIWVPLGKSKLSGASVVERSGNWAKIKVGSGPVVASK